MPSLQDYLRQFDPSVGVNDEIDFSKMALQPAPKAPPAKTGKWSDLAVTGAKGVIGAGEALVGLANLPTMGYAGKALEGIGYRPAEAKAALEEQYSPYRQELNKGLAETKGFLPTLGYMAQNPSTIGHAIVESIPATVGGGAIGRGVGALAPKLGFGARAGIGEGAVIAGGTAESIRQQTEDGTLSAGQVGASLAAGAIGGLIGAKGAQIATKFGLPDVDVALVGGSVKDALKPGYLKRVGTSALVEGVFEELPQSAQEQVFQNVALGRPFADGVAEAAAQGMMAGMGMGAGFAATQIRQKPAGQITDDDLKSGVDEALAPPAPPAAPSEPMQAEYEQAQREFAVANQPQGDQFPGLRETPTEELQRMSALLTADKGKTIAGAKEIELAIAQELAARAPQPETLAQKNDRLIAEALAPQPVAPEVDPLIAVQERAQREFEIANRPRDTRYPTLREASTEELQELAARLASKEGQKVAGRKAAQEAIAQELAARAPQPETLAQRMDQKIAANVSAMTEPYDIPVPDRVRAVNEGRDLFGTVQEAAPATAPSRQTEVLLSELEQIEQSVVDGTATPRDVVRMQQVRDMLGQETQPAPTAQSAAPLIDQVPKKILRGQDRARLAKAPVEELPARIYEMWAAKGGANSSGLLAPELDRLYAQVTGQRIQDHPNVVAGQTTQALKAGMQAAPTQGRIENIQGSLAAVPILTKQDRMKALRATQASVEAGQQPAAVLGQNIPEAPNAVQEPVTKGVDVQQPAQTREKVAKGNTQGNASAAKGQAEKATVTAIAPKQQAKAKEAFIKEMQAIPLDLSPAQEIIDALEISFGMELADDERTMLRSRLDRATTEKERNTLATNYMHQKFRNQGKGNGKSTPVAEPRPASASDNTGSGTGTGGTAGTGTGGRVRGRAGTFAASDSTVVAVGDTASEPATDLRTPDQVIDAMEAKAGKPFSNVRRAMLRAQIEKEGAAAVEEDQEQESPYARSKTREHELKEYIRLYEDLKFPEGTPASKRVKERVAYLASIAEVEYEQTRPKKGQTAEQAAKAREDSPARKYLDALPAAVQGEVSQARRAAATTVKNVSELESLFKAQNDAVAKLIEAQEAQLDEYEKPTKRKVRSDRTTDRRIEKDYRLISGEQQKPKKIKPKKMDESGAAQGVTAPGFHTQTSLAVELAKTFGQKFMDAVKSGRVVILPNQLHLAAVTGKLEHRMASNQGLYVYDTRNQPDGVTYFVAGNIARDVPGFRAVDIALHEIGEHAGMQHMLGKQNYMQLLTRIRTAMARNDSGTANGSTFDKDVAAAQKRLLKSQQGQAREVLAYLIQHTPDAGILKKMWAQIKAWLVKRGWMDIDRADAQVLRALAEGATAKWLKEVGPTTPKDSLLPGASEVDFSGARMGVPLPATIKIDGVSRPTTNSNGQQIAPTEEAVRNFWAWFGNSTVVDKQGRPKVMYHGSKADIAEFKSKATQVRETGNKSWDNEGIYFTTNPSYADDYSTASFRADGPAAVYPVYLRIENPVVITKQPVWNKVVSAVKQGTGQTQLTKSLVEEFNKYDDRASHYISARNLQQLLDQGIDGVVNDRLGTTVDEYVVFSGAQVKSAVGNSGEFSRADRRMDASGISSPTTLKTLTDYKAATDAAKGLADKVSKTKLADMKLSTFQMVIPWLTKHHMISQFDKWLGGGLEMNGRADSIQETMTTRMNQLFNEPHQRFLAIERADKERSKKITELMQATEFQIDPRKSWDKHTHLHDLTGWQLQQAKDFVAQYGQIWGKMNAEDRQVYNDLATMNQTMYTAELALGLYNMARANPSAKDLPAFQADPSEQFRESTTTHGSIKAAQDYWRGVMDKYTAALDQHVAQQRGLLPQKPEADPDYQSMVKSVLRGIQSEKAKQLVRRALRTKEDKDLSDEQKKIARHLSPLEAQMRMVNETAATFEHAPYFHLGRFGDHFVSFRVRTGEDNLADPAAMTHVQAALAKAFPKITIRSDATDPHVFARFESVGEQQEFEKAIREMQKQGWLMQPGVKDKNNQDLGEIVSGSRNDVISGYHTAGPNWLTRVVESIQAEDYDDATKEHMVAHVRSLYLDSLPDNAAIKVKQKREGRPGWDADMMRSYAHRMRIGSNRVGSLAAEPTRTQSFAVMKDAQSKAQTNPDLSAPRRGQIAAVVSEFERRNSDQMSVPNTPAIDKLRALNHAYFLGMSPSYVLIQMTQLGVLTWPELAKKNGFVKSAKAVAEVTPIALKVMSTVIKEGYKQRGVKGAADMVVTSEMLEKAGVSEADADFIIKVMAAGKIDIGNAAREIGRVAEGETGSEALKIASSFGYASETVTRITTALASKRLYDAKPANQKPSSDPVKYAIEVIDESMLNYTSTNIGRMTGKQGVASTWTPVMFSFLQYQFQLLEKMYREFYNAYTSDPALSKEEREAKQKEARRFLGSHMFSMLALAGTLGLPFATAIAAAADKLCGMFSDDYCDSKTALRNMTSEVFGRDIEPMVSKGLLSRALGFDISERAGEGNLLPFSKFLADKRKMEDALKDLAWSSWGAPSSMIAGIYKGYERMADGDMIGGMQEAVPLALKGPIKAFTMSEKGYTDNAGNVLPMTPGAYDIMLQAIGLNPGEKADYQQAKFAQSQRKGVLSREGTMIRQKLASAIERGDQTAMRDWMSKAQDYDAKNPERGILPSMGATLQQRARARAQAVGVGTPLGVSVKDYEAQQFTSFYRPQ